MSFTVLYSVLDMKALLQELFVIHAVIDRQHNFSWDIFNEKPTFSEVREICVLTIPVWVGSYLQPTINNLQRRTHLGRVRPRTHIERGQIACISGRNDRR